MSLFVVALLASVAAPDQPAVPADVAELEKNVLDYRRAIRRGHVVLAQKVYLNGVEAPEREEKTTAWFDGKQMRSDIMLRFKKDQPFHREVHCRNCEFDGYFTLFPEEKLDDRPVALALHPMQDNPNPDAYPVLDPRLLGMVVDDSANLALSRSRLDNYVGAIDRKSVTMRQEAWKGMDSERIEYQVRDISVVRVWVVPAWGPSVGRIEVEADAKGLHHLDSVESEYQPVGGESIWYPRSCVYERWVDGKQTEKEVAEVQEASLNEPLSPNVFRLAGMDIPVGWPVTGFRNEGMSYWNGKEVVPEEPPPLPLTAASPTTTKWPYAIAAVALAAAAAAAGWYFLRKKPTPPPKKV